MSRRLTIILILILIAGMGALAYILQQKKRAWAASPYGSIPVDAGIVIEAVDMPGMFSSLASGNEIVKGMSEINELKSFTKAIRIIDSLSHRREFVNLTGNNPVLISLHLLGKKRLTPLFTFAAAPEIREKHIKDILSDIPGYILGERQYEGSNIYELRNRKDDNNSYFLALNRGVMIISPSHILAEAAIRQGAQEKGIRDLPGFRQVSDAAGKHENKLYIIFNNMPELISLLGGVPGTATVDDFAGLASSMETDIYLKKSGLILSGYIQASDSGQSLYKYRFKEPGSYNIYRFIPAGAAMFQIMTNNDPPSIKTPDEETRYITDILKSRVEGTMARVYLDIKGQETELNKLMLIDLEGSNATEDAFSDELDQFYERNGKDENDYIIKYNPDAESEYIIYKLPVSDLGYQLGGDFAEYTGSGYATFYDDILVLSEEPGTLSKFIYDNILNRTLANDLSYREFESTMPSKAGYYFYCVPAKIIPLLEGVLNEEIVKGLTKNIEALRKLQAVGYQFVSSNDMIYNTLSLMYKPEPREEAKAMWESLLDTVALSKPLFFTNHYTGGKEIFIQDMNHKLYLINSAGRILWKRPSEEAIRGNAYMVDYYNNGKLQILFATKNYLHLIDRNGNYVERYPVQLRSPATNGLALFDYENNKNYRLFICGEDRKVYAYDKTGSTVKGWKQFRTTGPVNNDVEFFRVSGKDYLVLNDKDNMYILNRRGNVRVEMKEQVARSTESALRLTTGTRKSMVLASDEGEIITVNFSGEVNTFSVDDFSANPVFEYFDIDADGLGEYIFFDDNKVKAYDDDRSKMFSISLTSDDIIGPFGLVFAPNDKKIGFVDAAANQVYMVDEKGKNLKGFPLNGTTPYSVGKLDRGSSFNLITGGRDSFLYNYEITR